MKTEESLLYVTLQACYTTQAEHFVHTRKRTRPEIDLCMAYIREHLPWWQDYVVSEVWCGWGRLFPYLFDVVGERLTYTWSDFAAGMIAQAQKAYPEAHWVCDDMLTYIASCDDCSHDLVIAIASVQHLMSHEQRKLFWAHVYRVLQYEGHCILVNWSYSDRFLQKYWKQQALSLMRSCMSSWKWNDIRIPWKDPQWQTTQHVRKRYYHIFTLHELRMLSTMHGFIVEQLGYVLQDGSWSVSDWRKSRNSVLILRKGVA